MYETFRMMGAQHEADLERHAADWNLGVAARESRRSLRVRWTRLAQALMWFRGLPAVTGLLGSNLGRPRNMGSPDRKVGIPSDVADPGGA